MANHESAEKRDRQRVKRTARNRSAKASLRTTVKKARAAIEEGAAKTAAAPSIVAAVSAVDRAASKGIVHPKAASRTKSRLAKAANRAAQAAK